MTYQSTILADSPLIYFRLDETTGTSVTNIGSSGGTGTIGAGVLLNQAAAGTLDGKSMYFPNVNNTAVVTSSASVSTATWTMETWYKHNTGFTDSADRRIMQQGSATVFTTLWVNASSGLIRIQDSSAGYNAGKTVAGIGDGNWHHIVVTKSGTTLTYYVDGVSKGTSTQTSATRTGAVILSAPNTASSITGWLDEPAFYNTALSSTQVGNHYAAGTEVPVVSVSVSVPAMSATLASVTPSVGIDKTNAVPAMSATVGMPSVSLVTNSNLSVPAIVVNLTAPVPNVGVHKEISVPAMTLGTVTAPNATFGLGFAYSSVSDGDVSAFSIEIDLLAVGAHGWFRTDPIAAPNGMQISSAILRVNPLTTNDSQTSTLSVRQIMTDWALNLEANAGPTFNAASLGTISIPANGINTWYELDVTGLVQSWLNGTANNYGIGFVATGGQTGSDPTRLHARAQRTAAQTPLAPQIVVTYVAAPPQEVTVNAPVATLSIGGVAPKFFNIVEANPIEMTLTGVEAGGAGTADVLVDVVAATQYLTFVGGKSDNPDFTVNAVPIQAGLVSTVEPSVGMQYPVYAFPEPMALNLTQGGNVGIDLVTNRIIPVANAMAANIRMVGIYNEEADRYLQAIPATVDADDIWLRLNDQTGATRAADYVYAPAGVKQVYKNDGTYFGSPTFRLPDGPGLRPAVHFNGSTDYLVVGPYSYEGKYYTGNNNLIAGMALTIEFSFRTTQQDGVVFIGGGGQSGTSPNVNVRDEPKLTGAQLTLEAGQLVIRYGTSATKVRKYIADGEWHHIVMSIPSVDEQVVDDALHFDTIVPTYVAIDGKPILVRRGALVANQDSAGYDWIPYSFMAKATPLLGGPDVAVKSATGHLAGDLSNLIIRLHKYTTMYAAEDIYYEWSDATIVEAEPMTLSLDTIAPFKVRGNTKKMLAVYGLPWGYEEGRPMFNYFSNLSGMLIENLSSIGESRVHPDRVGFLGGVTYQKPKTFMLEGYMVYPVSITGDNNINGITSAAGVLNPDAVTGPDGKFIDDSTGVTRFINLQEDLLGDVTDYDVVTVVNYPWVRPDSAPNAEAKATGEYQGAQPVQNDMALSDFEWEQARDAFRDSLLQAAYDGVNLWIGEYHMAQHLGFIKGYDIHESGNNVSLDRNKRARDLDKLYVTDGGNASFYDQGQGGYYFYPQVNTSRRIVALEEDLTTVPSNEFGDYIESYHNDSWKPYGSILAWNIMRRPEGLQVGDLVQMSMLPLRSQWFAFGGSYAHPSAHLQYKRMAVISARPEGIVGKVIAREANFYYGPNGVVVDNPYKNNAVTIVAERGSVVRGRAIAGRVFMEFMETDILPSLILENEDKTMWHGGPGGPTSPRSFWDFDSRRDKEIKLEAIQTGMVIDASGGGNSGFIVKNTITNYFSYTNAGRIYNRRVSMHARGLNWLANAPEINAGDAIVFTDAIVVDLVTPAPTFDQTRNPTVEVVGLMRLDLEVRQPAEYSDGSIEVKALPMSLDLKLNGLGVRVQAPPMSLSVAMVNPFIEADVETITVYMDGQRNITLFLKEDN